MGIRYTQNNFYITDDEALDARQGPFNSVSEALDFIEHRYQGLSVYITSGTSVVEYWFRDGVANGDLIIKSSGSTSSGIPQGTASGTDTYTVSLSGVISYNDGDAYLVRFTNGNTTGCTLNINSLGAKTLYRNNDGALIGGDIVSGAEMLCVYNLPLDGFQVIGTAPNTLLAYVTNVDSVTLTKGMPVYAFGGQGDRLTVKRANNSGDSTSAQTIGLVLSASIGVNQKGLIMMRGLLDGLNILPTSTWADGDPVYLGATDGSITKIKPHAPNHLVYLGFVTNASNGSAGRLYVAVQNGYELQELHNVQAQSPSGNDTLYYNSGDSQWKTASIPTILGYTPVTNARTLTINGTTSDLSANRSWSVGTVTSVSALTIGTSGTDLSSTIATETTTPVITLNVPTASASNRGVLSSTDWSTFNGKQNALTNPVTGTGTNNEIAAFNSTGSTITSLSTSTYPSLTELSYVKGVTSAIQTQLNALPRVIYTNYTAESVTSTSTSNALSTFALTVADADWPLGGIVKIMFAMDRTAGTGQSYLGIQINSSTSRWVGAGGTSLVGELNFIKEAASTIRVHYGPSNTSNGPYQAQNSTSVTATASSGNYVFSFLCYVQSGTSSTVAFRYMKALMIP